MTSNNDLAAFIRTILGTTRLAIENDDVTHGKLDEAAGILSAALAVTGMAANQPADAARRFAEQNVEMQARIDEALKIIDDWHRRPLSGDSSPLEAPNDAVRAALLGDDAVPRPDVILPTTREQLAKFFGGIRLLGSGAVVTGHFVQHALDLLDARRGLTPPTRESLAAFFAALPKCATEALAAEQIDDATARRVINRMIYGNPTPEHEVPGE